MYLILFLDVPLGSVDHALIIIKYDHSFPTHHICFHPPPSYETPHGPEIKEVPRCFQALVCALITVSNPMTRCLQRVIVGKEAQVTS